MKKHDFFHEMSDDMRDWRAGHYDFLQIVDMISNLPAEQRENILAEVPVKVRPQWVEYLNVLLTSKGKL